jgi:hypothetical protein
MLQGLIIRNARRAGFVGVCLAACIAMLGANQRASAQQGQGKYITEASAALIKLIDVSNTQGFVLENDLFSLGGGWLRQSQANWIPLYNINLQGGKQYRFLAAGDADTIDLDIQVLDAAGRVVAEDVGTESNAIVAFNPRVDGKYTVRLRLYASKNNLPCMTLAVVMAK